MDSTGNSWTQKSYSVGAGKHVLSWEAFVKAPPNLVGSPGETWRYSSMFGYIDQVQWTAAGDTKKPTAYATVKGGYYNKAKTVSLKISKAGNIYYTLNGKTPTTSSTKYTKALVISTSKTLKFFARDLAGNKSPIYTQKYTIDKTPPKVSSTSPKNSKIGVSRTATITIKFSEKIKNSTNWNYITVKNLKTGKTFKIKSKTIKNNLLYIKNSSAKSSSTWYQVTIPPKAIRDYAGNNLAKKYTFRFRTRA